MIASLKSSWRDGRVWLAFLSLQIPSLRALFKYLPSSWWPLGIIYAVAAFAFCAWLLRLPPPNQRSERLLKNPWLIPALFLILVCVNAFVYPIADARKSVGQGSDQDDALIQAAARLVGGRNPYEAGTDLYSHPLSPGPGWVLLIAPLSLSRLYVLLTPLCAAFAAFVLSRRQKSAGAKFVLLLMSSLAFWELMVSGSDMLAIGCLLVVAWFACFDSAALGIAPAVLSAVYLGLVSTSRALFIYVVPLFAVLLRPRSSRAAIVTVIVGLGAAVGLHAGFYLWNPAAYSPLHIFGKGEALMPPWLMVIALIACAAVGIVTFLRARATLASALFLLWLCLAAPMLFVSLGDLLSQSWNFARWEGANYLALLMPLAMAAIVSPDETSRAAATSVTPEIAEP